MPLLCGNSFPRLKTRHFINFAARRDWCLHRDEACYCPVSGMPSGWGDGESVSHLCRCFSGRGGVCGTNERFFTGFQKPQVSPACLEKFHLLLFGLNCKGPVLKQIVGWIQNSNHLCWLWQKTFVNTSLFAAWVFDANGPLGGIREKYDLSQWKLYPNIPCPRRRLLCCFGSFELWKDPIVVLVAWYRGLPWISFSRGFNITPKGFFVCDCSFNLFAFLHCFPIFFNQMFEWM